MDRFFKALILFAFATTATAASYQTASLPTGLVQSGSSFTYVSSGATAANGAFSVGPTVRVGGTAVTMPAKARIAANAGRFAVNAVRLTPTGLIVGAIATWLIGYGLDYAVDHWRYTSPSLTGTASFLKTINACYNGSGGYNSSSYYGLSPADANAKCLQGASVTMTNVGSAQCPSTIVQSGGPYVCTFDLKRTWIDNQMFYGQGTVFNVSVACPAGATLQNGNCVTPGAARTATEADFEAPATAPLPDAAAQQLAQSGQPVPVEAPVLSTPAAQPISEPYTDPLTKTTKRDYVQATPSPTPDDPLRVRLEPFTQTVDATTGQPTAQSNPEASKTDPPDVCEKNPEAAICKKFDTPDDPTVQKLDKPVSITPQSGWGPDSSACPADIPLRQGGAFSYASTCDAATKVRPITIACAWLVAALIVLRGLKES